MTKWGQLQMRNNLYTNRIVVRWLFGSFQTWNFLDSTATPWTDVNFVDDQFLRTLGNHPFLFFRFWWYLSE
ncbi:unnamed protein product [Rhizophagus irregularis]|nr:unnamed protein product [Rhizophagus irregularis]